MTTINAMIDKHTESVVKSPIIQTIFSSPIYTALLISIILALIIVLFIGAEFKFIIKIMFYTFILMFGVILIQNKILLQEYTTRDQKEMIDKMKRFDRTGGDSIDIKSALDSFNLKDEGEGSNSNSTNSTNGEKYECPQTLKTIEEFLNDV